MNPAHPPTLRLAREAMRTRFELVLPLSEGEPGRLRAVGEAVLEEIAEVESFLSPYRSDSALSRLLQEPAGKPVAVEERLFQVLQKASALSSETGGAFDMTIGPLVQLWRQEGKRGTVPTGEEIAQAREGVGMSRLLHLDEATQTVTLEAKAIGLDPGAIGKGYALDRAERVLRENGIDGALLHGGTSTVLAVGGPWPIAIQDPTEPEKYLTTVHLTDTTLSVSAVHGRTFWAAERCFGHILDPRTGYPVEKTRLAAVTALRGVVSDALSTAALVTGSAGLPDLTTRFPEAGFLIAEAEQSENTTLHVVATENFGPVVTL